MKKYSCYNLRGLEAELRNRSILTSGATIFTHQLEVLLGLTGAAERIKTNASLWRHFLMVNQWVPGWRYSADLSNQADSRTFLDAVGQVIHWIEVNI